MPLQTLPAGPADISEIAVIHHEAFKDDPILGRLMPDVTPEDKNAYDKKFYEKAFAHAHLTGSVFRKVVADTGEVLAFAKWVYPHTLSSEQQADKDKLDLTSSCPKGTNLELHNRFFAELDAKRKRNCDERKDYFLHILIVAPAHQRRGLGTMLIEEGLRNADKDNAKAYVEASAKGLQLYKRHGWREIDFLEIDMTSYGEIGTAREELLMREPKPVH